MAVEQAAPQRRVATEARERRSAGQPRMPLVLAPWLEAQAINVGRHAEALRPFGSAEFGSGGAAPSEGHIQAVNRLIAQLRTSLLRHTREVEEGVEAAIGEP